MYRKINLSKGQFKPKTTVVGLFPSDKTLAKVYAALNEKNGGTLGELIKRPEFSAKKGTVSICYPTAGPHQAKTKAAQRVVVLGLGDKAKFDPEVLRLAGAKLVKQLDAVKETAVSVEMAKALDGVISPIEAGRALAEGMMIGNFSFDKYKAGDDPKSSLRVKLDSKMSRGFQRGLIVGAAVNEARQLAATPPNVANPKFLASYCRKLARDQAGLRVSVIDANKAAAMKMGGLVGVGQGSNVKPALICMEYTPARGSKVGKASGGPVMLVGKAVTFDTGGYSLKPAASMLSMKYDKCGGVAVIATMAAIAKLKLPVHVVGLIPAAENMVDSDAYRPSDILRMYNGVTVEVTNTDAEGRLILGDALAYGYKKYKPRAIVDIATLTGGVNYALGSFCAGLFCNDDKLLKKIENAGSDSGEKLWQLPLWDEHRDVFKGNHSDIVNSAGKGAASASMGAAFLSYFVDKDSPRQMPKLPWAHLDIASTGTVDSDGAMFVKGATGFGVRLMIRLLEGWV